MDARGGAETESGGGGGGGRSSSSVRGARRSAVAVWVVQSLLTAVCAAFSLSMFLNQQQRSGTGIHMQANYTDTDEPTFLALWNNSVWLSEDKRLKLRCAGPYVVYLWTCVKNYSTDSFANLTMEQNGKEFHLQSLRGTGCQEKHGVFMLSDKHSVMFKVAKDSIKIKSLFIGLYYMLGNECFSLPHDDNNP